MSLRGLKFKRRMKIIPAIDILDGRCTQLIGGKPETAKFYGNPVEIAKRWESDGAEILHVIDLNSALGTGENTDTVLRIKNSVGIPVQFGGGIRSIKKAREMLNLGIDRIILGTLAVNDLRNDFMILKKLRSEFSRDRIMVALDSKDGKIVVKGWQEKTQLSALKFIKKVEDLVWGFLYTDVDVEGQMKGINLERIKKIIKGTKLPVIVSGGISTLEDIRKLKEIGAWGVVLGKALYEGKIEIKGFYRHLVKII